MKNSDMPAAPVFDGEGNAIWLGHGLEAYGLTKREMIAMHLAQGLLVSGGYKGSHSRELAEYAIRYADALLEELDRTNETHN